jgi:valyl-tRNA synthetase
MDQPIAKEVYDKTVDFFTQLMQLLHPYMPFITEEIYHLLADRNDDLCVKQFEAIQTANASLLQQGQLLQEAITGLRDARVKHQLKPKEPIKLFIQSSAGLSFTDAGSLIILAKQVNAGQISYVTEAVPNSIAVVIGKDKFFIQSEKPVDTGAQKDELLKELDYLQKFLESVNKKLSNERFVQHAKPEVVQLEQKKKADAEEKIKVIQDSLSNL